jgi:hypothetical protein
VVLEVCEQNTEKLDVYAGPPSKITAPMDKTLEMRAKSVLRVKFCGF